MLIFLIWIKRKLRWWLHRQITVQMQLDDGRWFELNDGTIHNES